MGSRDFTHFVEGVTDVDDAFNQAVAAARHEHGHGGYTGTIAEKEYFVVITETVLSPEDAEALAGELFEAQDPRIDNKDGPAGAIPFTGGWLFFGWASA